MHYIFSKVLANFSAFTFSTCSLFPTIFAPSAPPIFPINVPISTGAPAAVKIPDSAKNASPAPIVSFTDSVNAGHSCVLYSSSLFLLICMAPKGPLVSHPTLLRCFPSFLSFYFIRIRIRWICHRDFLLIKCKRICSVILCNNIHSIIH